MKTKEALERAQREMKVRQQVQQELQRIIVLNLMLKARRWQQKVRCRC